MSALNLLLRTLSEAEAILRHHGEDHWSVWIARGVSLLRTGDAFGLEHLRSGVGGTGSFNDLRIMPVNGHHIRDHEVRPVNERLEQLRSEITRLVYELRRSAR